MVVLRDPDTQEIVICDTNTGLIRRLDVPNLLYCHMYCERNGKIVYIGPDNFLYCLQDLRINKLYEKPIEWFDLVEILIPRSDSYPPRVALRYPDRVDLISGYKLSTIHSGTSDRAYMEADLSVKVGIYYIAMIPHFQAKYSSEKYQLMPGTYCRFIIINTCMGLTQNFIMFAMFLAETGAVQNKYVELG